MIGKDLNFIFLTNQIKPNLNIIILTLNIISLRYIFLYCWRKMSSLINKCFVNPLQDEAVFCLTFNILFYQGYLFKTQWQLLWGKYTLKFFNLSKIIEFSSYNCNPFMRKMFLYYELKWFFSVLLFMVDKDG